MDKLKIADKLDAWVKDNFGNKFYVNAKDGDLNLGIYIEEYITDEIAWFIDYDIKRFDYSETNSSNINTMIVSKGVISKFYQKAIETIDPYSKEENDKTNLDQLVDNIKTWASDRGIDKQSPDAGTRKTLEEFGELLSAYSRQNKDDMMDSMGDMTVCLINLATQMGLDFKECLEMAYNEISDRKGKMVNGVFVKEADLKNEKDN